MYTLIIAYILGILSGLLIIRFDIYKLKKDAYTTGYHDALDIFREVLLKGKGGFEPLEKK